MVKSAFESPFSDEHFVVAQKLADQLQSGDAGGALKTALGLPQENPAAAGTATGEATNAAIVAALTAGLVKGAGWATDKAAIVSKMSDDPDLVAAALKTIPRGPEVKAMFDKLSTAYQTAKAAQNPGPVSVLRNAQSPAWANFPAPTSPSAIEFEPIPATSLPSGRLPGHSAAFDAQFRPSALSKTDLESRPEQSIPEAMMKRGATGNEPVVSPANEPLNAALKNGAAQAQKRFEEAVRMKKAMAVGQWLKSGGITPEQVDLMEPEHWKMAERGAGVNNLSPQTIQAVKDLMRWGEIEISES